MSSSVVHVDISLDFYFNMSSCVPVGYAITHSGTMQQLGEGAGCQSMVTICVGLWLRRNGVCMFADHFQKLVDHFQKLVDHFQKFADHFHIQSLT